MNLLNKNHARNKNIIPLFDEPFVTIEEVALRLANERRELVKLGIRPYVKPRNPRKLTFVCDESRNAGLSSNAKLLLVSLACFSLSLFLFACH